MTVYILQLLHLSNRSTNVICSWDEVKLLNFATKQFLFRLLVDFILFIYFFTFHVYLSGFLIIMLIRAQSCLKVCCSNGSVQSRCQTLDSTLDNKGALLYKVFNTWCAATVTITSKLPSVSCLTLTYRHAHFDHSGCHTLCQWINEWMDEWKGAAVPSKAANSQKPWASRNLSDSLA